MSSGVGVADEVVDKYNQIKMKKNLRFVTFKIQDKKTIIFDKEGEASMSYADFVEALPKDEPRYALVDYDYTSEDGRPQSKLTFIHWCPEDNVGVKEKMLYASSKDAIKKKFPGIMKELQCNDMGDLEAEEVNKKMLQK